jgi:ABC-2 type transport system permease protein
VTGTWLLVRHFVRRDRWMVLWWALGITLLYWSQAVSVKGLYATQAEFDRAAALMETNTAFVAMAGPARALNTIGGQVTWQATAFGRPPRPRRWSSRCSRTSSSAPWSR